jgi:acetyl esterase
MPLDADIASLLASLASNKIPALSDGTPEQARANYDAAPKPDPDPLARVEDRTIPGPAGPIPVRLYAATDDTGPGASAPAIIVFFHGGGWVLSSIEGHDRLARRLALRTGALVVSVEYRLAPEHPFPGPFDDCWAVTEWLAAHGNEVGGDPTRLAVAGDSAGGNLAAGVAIKARDEGLPLCFQLLIYPCVDPTADTGSMVENATGYFLSARDMAWFWDNYVPAEHRRNPYAVPMAADDLTGLPPALVQTAEFDPLRDQGEAFGQRLIDAGVPTTVTRYDGVVHGFAARWHVMSGALAAHDEFETVVAAALRR